MYRFEKQCDQKRTTWLPLNDFSHKDCKTKLLDGLGTSANLIYQIVWVSWMLVYQSEFMIAKLIICTYRSQKQTIHGIEDCLKNLKSSSDFLKFFTMKRIKIPCIYTIGNEMTLSLCSISSKYKWDFFELISPNKPVIGKEDYENLSCIFNIVTSFNKGQSTSPIIKNIQSIKRITTRKRKHGMCFPNTKIAYFLKTIFLTFIR